MHQLFGFSFCPVARCPSTTESGVRPWCCGLCLDACCTLRCIFIAIFKKRGDPDGGLVAQRKYMPLLNHACDAVRREPIPEGLSRLFKYIQSSAASNEHRSPQQIDDPSYELFA